METPLLETIGLRKRFGGVKAVDGVDLRVRDGELLAIIGPNGAGKTTLFNLLTGMLRPESGRILFAGQEITRCAPSEIARLGIGRSFQLISIFPELTAYENALVAVLSHLGLAARPLASLKKARDAHARTVELLERVGLRAEADQPGGSLSRGNQKRLDLAIALAGEPRLLLLDEPTAGLAPGETAEITALLDRVIEEAGITILFSEHDMKVVFAVASRIAVMHQGRIIADGNPEAVRLDPGVQQAYLGRTSGHAAGPGGRRAPSRPGPE
ncbi:MAG: ABC transporter ATP-binding protein [Candidatus Rokubacteria bacterium]|nr:ABC transporter ATP-binding protein [Candidatus Rokubacteria bacterium]